MFTNDRSFLAATPDDIVRNVVAIVVQRLERQECMLVALKICTAFKEHLELYRVN